MIVKVSMFWNIEITGNIEGVFEKLNDFIK